MELKNDEIIVYDDDGKEYLMKILFTYYNEKRKTEYVYFYAEDKEDEVIVMKYNDKHELFDIEDDDEMKEAQEVFDCFNEDPNMEQFKNN